MANRVANEPWKTLKNPGKKFPLKKSLENPGNFIDPWINFKKLSIKKNIEIRS